MAGAGLSRHDYDLTIVSHTEPMDIGIYGRETTTSTTQPGLPDDDGQARRRGRARTSATPDGPRRRTIAEDSVNGFLFQLAKHGVWNAKVEGLWANSPVQANDLTRCPGAIEAVG